MSRSRIFALGSMGGLAVLALAAQSGMTLSVNGAVASTDVRMIGGKAYVPIADVAKALNMSVQKAGSGYAMAPAGGAGMLKGSGGRMGAEVFTGKWRFTVLDWQRMDHYEPKLIKMHSWKDRYDAEPGQELIVVSCRVKNGTPKKDELVFSTDWEGVNNAITTQDEQSYPPIGFDLTETETAPVGVAFLPGSAINFKMIFQVPKGTEPKDVVFTALRYSMRAGFDQKKEKPQDIRVSLSR